MTSGRREPESAGGPSTPVRSGGRPVSPEAPAVGVHEGDVPTVRRTRDGELAVEGWVRRFTGSPPRLVEVKELYESTGQEVFLDEVLPGELAPECEGCTLALSLFKVIYTRRPGAD